MKPAQNLGDLDIQIQDSSSKNFAEEIRARAQKRRLLSHLLAILAIVIVAVALSAIFNG